jgi:hypothetical protein
VSLVAARRRRTISTRLVPFAPVSIQPVTHPHASEASAFSRSCRGFWFGPSLALKTCAAEWAVRIEEDQT